MKLQYIHRRGSVCQVMYVSIWLYRKMVGKRIKAKEEKTETCY
jgi:hypothetical protein